jgi:hypothetical protein
VEADFRWNVESAPATDYDRACDIKDYAGVLQVGPVRTLVLGDMPQTAAWWPLPVGGILVRWMWANSESEVVESLTAIPEESWDEGRVTIDVGSQGLVVFDSACPGAESSDEERLTLDLPAGEWSVQTAEFGLNSKTALILHRLRPRS